MSLNAVIKYLWTGRPNKSAAAANDPSRSLRRRLVTPEHLGGVISGVRHYPNLSEEREIVLKVPVVCDATVLHAKDIGPPFVRRPAPGLLFIPL